MTHEQIACSSPFPENHINLNLHWQVQHSFHSQHNIMIWLTLSYKLHKARMTVCMCMFMWACMCVNVC